jgi:uncharacterized protein (TIGR02453 family)
MTLKKRNYQSQKVYNRAKTVMIKVHFPDSFQGFSPQTLQFLHDLSENNNREWFAEHKSEYVKFVSEPMRRLVVSLTPMMSEIDPLLITAPNRTISRIYRDTRFSNDKTPYRPRIWFAFKREVNCWTETPTYFFQVEEETYSLGMGMYAATASTMRNFREMIDDNPTQFANIIEPLCKNKTLKLDINQYKRKLPCNHNSTINTWYQNKSIAIIATQEPDKNLFSPKLIKTLINKFILLKPLYDFLWNAVNWDNY